jgi:diadenosine tetraphosphate (Ap4A) HIT family hydrolase
LLLKDNALFPWLILVPEVEGVEDLHQLPEERYDEIMAAVRRVSLFAESHFGREKLNVACIGNVVRQMHIHVVARSSGDAAWPGTIWAHEGKAEYSATEVEAIREAATAFLGLA